MPISEVQELLAKYKKQEENIESKIKRGNNISSLNARDSDGSILKHSLNIGSVQQAKERNKLILKNLETVKGNLRSKAIFSPTEMQWKKIYERYRVEPALVVTRWKCHLPVFV